MAKFLAQRGACHHTEPSQKGTTQYGLLRRTRIKIALYDPANDNYGCKIGLRGSVPAEGKSRRSALMACVSRSSCWLPASLTFRHLHAKS